MLRKLKVNNKDMKNADEMETSPCPFARIPRVLTGSCGPEVLLVAVLPVFLSRRFGREADFIRTSALTKDYELMTKF